MVVAGGEGRDGWGQVARCRVVLGLGQGSCCACMGLWVLVGWGAGASVLEACWCCSGSRDVPGEVGAADVRGYGACLWVVSGCLGDGCLSCCRGFVFVWLARVLGVECALLECKAGWVAERGVCSLRGCHCFLAARGWLPIWLVARRVFVAALELWPRMHWRAFHCCAHGVLSGGCASCVSAVFGRLALAGVLLVVAGLWWFVPAACVLGWRWHVVFSGCGINFRWAGLVGCPWQGIAWLVWYMHGCYVAQCWVRGLSCAVVAGEAGGHVCCLVCDHSQDCVVLCFVVWCCQVGVRRRGGQHVVNIGGVTGCLRRLSVSVV